VIDPAAIFAVLGELIHMEWAPCADGVHHTSYLLVATERDHVVAPFPAYNFALTSAEHQAEVRRLLADRGLTLDLSE
jgi:hypothetical protein